MLSIEIREFSEAIKNFIYQSEIPWEVKRLALQEIFGEVERNAISELKQEIEERNRREPDAESV